MTRKIRQTVNFHLEGEPGPIGRLWRKRIGENGCLPIGPLSQHIRSDADDQPLARLTKTHQLTGTLWRSLPIGGKPLTERRMNLPSQMGCMTAQPLIPFQLFFIRQTNGHG